MPLKLKKKISPGKISHKNAKNSCQRVAKGKKGAKTRVADFRVAKPKEHDA